jgi:tetratricopeptide (TPR) repeat protein
LLTFFRTGDYYAALESLELAVRYCDDIQLYCLVYANMVMVLNKMSRFRKAIGAYKECMKMFPDLTVHHLPLLLNVAASHYERAQYLECKKLLDTCKDIIDKEIVEVNHWRGVQCLRSGRLNNKLGYYKLAERQLLQAYDIFTKLYKGKYPIKL